VFFFTSLFVAVKLYPTETKHLEQTKHRSCKSSRERCWAEDRRGPYIR